MSKDEALSTVRALKLALEALEKIGYVPDAVNPHPIATAITAIKEALMSHSDGAQSNPWEKFCDSNCVWTDHHPDCKLAERLPLTDEEIWVLTSEYNDYDQHGEYFEAVFIGKPTSEQIQKHCHVTEQGAVHILNGGGRVKYEDQWYNLRKEKAAHGIKGEA